MAEEANDVNAAVAAPAEPQEPATPAPSPDENKTPEVDPLLDTLKDEPAEPKQPEEPAKPEPEEPESTPAPVAEDKPKGKAEDRKAQLNTEIRDLVAKRNALQTEVERANAEAYQPQTEADLVEQGLSETDAKVEALRQSVEMDKYNSQVAEAQLTIEHESSRVLSDFPIFNPDSPEFKPEIAKKAANILDKNLIKDENTGQIIGTNVSPYELYQTIADTYQASTVEGQIKGQQATEQMMANADSTGSASPPVKKTDPLMEILKSDD